MKQLLLLTGTLFVLLLVDNSCTKDKTQIAPVGDCADTISFNQTVLPIFVQNCSTSGCHDANSASSGYVFETHTQISTHATIALSTMNGTPQLMPLGGPSLADSLIQKVSCWIAQGKLNN